MPWCEGIAAAGRVEQGEPVRVLRVLRPVTVTGCHRRLSIGPGRGLSVSVHIELARMGAFEWQGSILPERFPGRDRPGPQLRTVHQGDGRTRLRFLTRKPLLQGCGPHSAALLFRNRVVGGLRMPDELVRHRVLDLIGDLALVGHPIEGQVIASHTCHDLNHRLIAT